MQIACDVIYILESKKYYSNQPAELIQTLYEYSKVV